jgi:hypothetical protein
MDIERVFSVFQAIFSIIQGAGHFCYKKFLLMTVCVIPRNMNINDEKGLYLEFFFDNVIAVSNPRETLTKSKFSFTLTDRLRSRALTPNSIMISSRISGRYLDQD